jgi:hypothetical protein
MRSPVLRLIFAASLLAACSPGGEGPDTREPTDNDPPLADLDELLAGAPKADEIPRDSGLGKYDALIPKKHTELRELMSPVKSQGKRGVCSIFSTTGLMEHLYIAAGHPVPDFSEQYLQWSTKIQLGAFPTSSGSNDGINIQAINQYGVVEESVWPYEPVQWGVENDPACDGEDTQPTHCYTNGHPSDEMMAAPKFFLAKPRWMNPQDIKAHIMSTGTGVTAGMTFFYQSWNHRKSELPTNAEYWDAGYVTYPNAEDIEASTTEELSAGHAILIIGWDDELEVAMRDGNGDTVLDGNGNPVMEKGFYIFKNSWGTAGFGINHELGAGYGYISKRYIHDYASVRTTNKPAPPVVPEVCGDGLDNDHDGAFDCQDATCASTEECLPEGVLAFEGQGDVAIPDNTPSGVLSTASVSTSGAITELVVEVNIKHTFRSDLRVELRHGGQAVLLHNRTGGGADDVIGSATITAFNGKQLAGDWQLFVSDNSAKDVGIINSWRLKVRVAD